MGFPKIDAAPYKDRRTSFFGVREIHGWKLKVYGISADGCELTESVIETALDFAGQHVGWPDREPGFGFMTFHIGEVAVWLLVDLWVDDILRHFLFRAPLDVPNQFTSGPDDGTMACVWELAVLVHERSAWIKHVLSQPGNPDYPAYMNDSLEIQVGKK